MKNKWYESITGNHQGLIIEENTGDNIAVTYKKEHAPIIVKAVNCHDELVELLKTIPFRLNLHQYENGTIGNKVLIDIKQALTKASA